MITKNIDCKVLEVERDAEGRFIIVKVEIEKKRYLLGNVYGPNKDDPEFFYRFLARVQAYTADYLLLGGDFNTVLDYTVDQSNMLKHGNNGAAEYINSCIEMTELIDIWR